MTKRKVATSSIDHAITRLVHETDHRLLGAWAADCAERVLHYFEVVYPEDKRPQQAIEACRTWARTGIFSMTVIRRASLGAHAAARNVEARRPAHSAARAAGQAVATAHVFTHSIAAAMYAATAIRDAQATPAAAEYATERERAWQYDRLLTLRDEETHTSGEGD